MIKPSISIRGKTTPSIKIKGKTNASIIRIYPELENIEITPTLEDQKFKSNMYGYSEVTVKAIEAKEINIVPSTEEQVKEGVFNKVTVMGDDNLVAENIKEGVEIFDVTGTAKGEPRLNIFMQEEEPETKEGIWIQTSELSYDKVEFDDDVFVNIEWDMWNIPKTPPSDYKTWKACCVGTDIYIFRGSDETYNSYKYDTINDTYTQISNPPQLISTGFGDVVSIGTDIYIFGGTNRVEVHKYDTLTDTYTQLSNMPAYLYNQNAVVYGKYIYLVGLYRGKLLYRYDTETDTYVQMKNIPFDYVYGSSAIVGTNIYIFGGTKYPTYCYKYDILTNTYTQLTNIPYKFYSGVVEAIGTNIVLLGGTPEPDYCYKYDTLTDTYTKITNIPFENPRDAVLVDNKIYVLGSTNNRILKAGSKEYENNSVVVSQGAMAYQTQLVDTKANGRMLVHFNDVFHYTTENKLDKSMPRYYGNGTEWIEI